MQRSSLLTAFLLVVLGAALSAHAEEPAGFIAEVDQANPARSWTSLNFPAPAGRLQFAIVSDRNGGQRPGIFEKAVDRLNLLQPQFVLCVGDLIPGYSEDVAEINRQRDEFDQLVHRLTMPFFFVPGNHDLSNLKAGLPVWEKRLGRPYYAFVYQDVLFLCLNTEDPPDTHISSAQAQWAVDTLNKYPHVRWTFVFMHQPMWVYGGPPKEDDGVEHRHTYNQTPRDVAPWSVIESALQGRPYTVFAGHFHEYMKYERFGHEYFILATTGGGMDTSFDYPPSGAMDHFVWVTMTAQGPQIANVVLDGVYDRNLVTEKNTQAAQFLAGPRQSSINVAPIYLDQDVFQQGTLNIQIRNASTVPMDAAVSFDDHPQIKLADTGLPAQYLPPGSEKSLQVSVRTETPVDPSSLSPLIMHTLMAFSTPEGKLLGTRGQLNVQPVRRYLCYKRDSVPTIDGQLDDWKELPFVVEKPVQILKNSAAWTSPNDCSYRLAVAYDEHYLYLAVDTKDDVSATVAAPEPWVQDGLEIRLDARPDPQRSQCRGNEDGVNVLFLALVPSDKADQPRIFKPEALPADTKIVCVKTPAGHVTEAAIPIKYLNEKFGGPWQAFRLDVAVDDLDDASAGEAGVAQLHWQPDWRMPNIPGSGTFARSFRRQP